MVDPAKAAGTDSGEAHAQQPRAEQLLDIRQLVRQHYQAVYRYAFRLTGCANEAEDATQQTFLVAQRKIHQVREPDKVDRWLFAILRSCFLKARRRQRPSPAANLELNVDEVAEARGPTMDESVDPERLQMVLADMPDEFRLVLLMFYFEELSYKEIAARLEVPIGTVMSRLSRAKDRLRRLWLASDTSDRDRSAKAGWPASPPATQGAKPARG
jgi:RNA polymerase sigma-70 factor (ECF subfamily)